MVLADVLAHAIELVLGNPSNTLLAATVLVVGWHIRSAAHVAKWFRFSGIVTMLLAGGLVFGVVDASAVMALVDAIVGLATALLPLVVGGVGV